jgi:Ca2+/H+ antiporter, TMEM165/GDT1 family
VPFITIAVAELGDKTQIAMMALAAKYRHTLQIFIGAIAASAVVDGSAVLLGAYFSIHLPKALLSLVAGVVFILFGAYMLLRGNEEESSRKVTKKSVLAMAFLLFFTSEFGDKSQFAALLFGTQYNIILTLLGTLGGIALVLVVMLLAGKYLRAHLSEKHTRIFSSLLFLAIGVWLLIGAAVKG